VLEPVPELSILSILPEPFILPFFPDFFPFILESSIFELSPLVEPDVDEPELVEPVPVVPVWANVNGNFSNTL